MTSDPFQFDAAWYNCIRPSLAGYFFAFWIRSGLSVEAAGCRSTKDGEAMAERLRNDTLISGCFCRLLADSRCPYRRLAVPLYI